MVYLSADHPSVIGCWIPALHMRHGSFQQERSEFGCCCLLLLDSCFADFFAVAKNGCL
jgi:hypothetical protein